MGFHPHQCTPKLKKALEHLNACKACIQHLSYLEYLDFTLVLWYTFYVGN